HGVADFFGVGRDGVIVRAAEREGRDIAIAGGEIFDRAARDVDHHQMGAALGLPFGPMAIEQRGVAAGFDLTAFFGVEAALVAGFVGAISENIAGEDELFAVGREEHAAGFGGEAGDLAGVRAVGVHDPDLRGAAAVRNE